MDFHVVGRCRPWALNVPTTLLGAEQRNLTMGLFQREAIPDSALGVPCNQNRPGGKGPDGPTMMMADVQQTPGVFDGPRSVVE